MIKILGFQHPKPYKIWQILKFYNYNWVRYQKIAGLKKSYFLPLKIVNLQTLILPNIHERNETFYRHHPWRL
jgi:hypothetical protein